MKRKQPKESTATQLFDLRATLAEDEAYRARLPEGHQARQVDAKIAYWKRQIAALEARQSNSEEKGPKGC